tara:strand:+ start:177 stop:920 length:744 start_codon:yes stop_codon:yes gene_type:complete
MNILVKVLMATTLMLMSSTLLATQPVLVWEWQVAPGKAGDFAAAFDDLQQSKVGQDRTAQVQLQSVTFNGTSPATHRVVALYPSLAELEKWNSKLMGSQAQQAFGSAIAEIATPVSQTISVPMQNWGEVSSDDVYWDLISINASDPASVLSGMNELMGSKDLSEFPGQVWLVQLFRGHAGSGGTMTHQIAIGWESMSEMEAFNDEMYQTKAWQKWIGIASQSFTIVNRESISWLKAYEHNYSLEDFD